MAVASLEDRIDGVAGSHRLLVTPEPQLVAVIFGPTLAFLTRAACALPINLENECVSVPVLYRDVADSTMARSAGILVSSPMCKPRMKRLRSQPTNGSFNRTILHAIFQPESAKLGWRSATAAYIGMPWATLSVLRRALPRGESAALCRSEDMEASAMRRRIEDVRDWSTWAGPGLKGSSHSTVSCSPRDDDESDIGEVGETLGLKSRGETGSEWRDRLCGVVGREKGCNEVA